MDPARTGRDVEVVDCGCGLVLTFRRPVHVEVLKRGKLWTHRMDDPGAPPVFGHAETVEESWRLFVADLEFLFFCVEGVPPERLRPDERVWQAKLSGILKTVTRAPPPERPPEAPGRVERSGGPSVRPEGRKRPQGPPSATARPTRPEPVAAPQEAEETERPDPDRLRRMAALLRARNTSETS